MRLAIIAWFAAIVIAGPSLADTPESKFVRRAAGNNTVIVFVHGVFGDGKSAWTSANGRYWPEMLTKDTSFDGADIFVYSYPTGFWATLSIDELAENMRALLVADGVTKYEKIIYLSHSMGGLVTRAFLLKNREVAARTQFAYFFSTPTMGSQVASIASALFDNPQVSKLKFKPEDYLGDLVRQWLAAGFQFPSYCAYEKRLTGKVALVVPMDSASSLCTKPLDPIDANHIDIVKPESEGAISYVVFKAAFTDAKVLQLEDKLDRKSGIKLAADVREAVRFSSSNKVASANTMLETLSVDKTPQAVFSILKEYNKDQIESAPAIGNSLYQFKIDYSDFESLETTRENSLIGKIEQTVNVRFRAGWLIYLQYIILRDGNTPDQVKKMGDFLNYEITWDDAERVYQTLSKDKEISGQTAQVSAAYQKVKATLPILAGAK